nr:hypothetical protein [Nocardioides marinisabuli]
MAGDQHAAGAGWHHPGQHPHRGRLAGAVAAQQPGRPAGRGDQVDARDRLVLAEAHVQVAHLDQGLLHA